MFGRREAVESILLSDLRSISYVHGGFCCTIGARGRRTAFLVPDALQVGLCVTRAARDMRQATAASQPSPAAVSC